jgi:hypothetical protein
MTTTNNNNNDASLVSISFLYSFFLLKDGFIQDYHPHNEPPSPQHQDEQGIETRQRLEPFFPV